jgi:hypothetical protein
VIFELIVIGLLRVERRGTGCKGRYDHVGEDGASLGKIEGDKCRVHGDLSEILAASEKFCVDGTNLVEHLAPLRKLSMN